MPSFKGLTALSLQNPLVAALICFIEFEILYKVIIEQFGQFTRPSELLERLASAGIITLAGVFLLTMLAMDRWRHHGGDFLRGLSLAGFTTRFAGMFGRFFKLTDGVPNSHAIMGSTEGVSKTVLIQVDLSIGHWQVGTTWTAIRMAASILRGDGKGPRLTVSPIGAETRDLHLLIFASKDQVDHTKATIQTLLSAHTRSLQFTLSESYL